MTDLPRPTADWVAATLGTPVVHSLRLAGGLDALMLRCTLADGRTVALRLLPDPGVAARQPVTTDLALLHALEGRDLPVPVVLGADSMGERAGCPALILSWIEGRPLAHLEEPVDAAHQVLEVLRQVHALDPADFGRLPRTSGSRVLGEPWPGLAAEPLGAALWRALRRELPPENRQLRPVHGDPWLGNLIWQGRRLAGVVDWSDAVLSDPEADLGAVRFDVALAAGPAAVASLPGGEHQRFWDLWTTSCWLANFEPWLPPFTDLGWQLGPGETLARVRTYAEFLLDT